MSFFSRLSVLFLFVVSTFALGQSTTQENLGAITAAQVASGLGWNLGGSETEFAAAAAAGATHVRLASCSWASLEGQSDPPNNVSTGFSLSPDCVSSLSLSKKYGLHPTILAAFGAPFHQILTLTLTRGAAAGATSLPVEFSSGVGGKTLSSIVYPYAYLADADGTKLSVKRSYSGSLIAGVSIASEKNATVTLASGLAAPLPAGTTLWVNEILYPSPLTASPTNPSVIAFARYAQYLAKQIHAFGVTGEVELWNEPPWFGDCWDNRRDCYDVDPKLATELPPGVANFGFVAVLQDTVPVPGVPYVWAGANKTSSESLLGPDLEKFSGATFKQPQAAITTESLHPYGNNPEDAMWSQPCILANPKMGQHCNLITGSSSNMVNGMAENVIAQRADPNFGIDHVITETGSSTLNGDHAHLARFTMRQYLGFMADGISFVEFYRLYDPLSSGQTLFSFITLTNNGTSFKPLPSYTAFAGLMSDLAPMKQPPVASYSSSSLPSVTSYSGTFNLDHLSIVGARPGDTANSIMFVLWQRSTWQNSSSAVVCQPIYTQPCWGTVTQPAEASTTVTIPSGLKIDQVVNLDTRAPVSYSQSGSTVTLGVSDDPVELMFIPAGDSGTVSMTPKLVFAAIADQTKGSSVVVSAASVSKGAITYSVVSGPATISGATVTATGAGTVVVKASQAAKGNYTSATATTSFNVTAKTPVISFTQIAPRTYGDAVTVKASSPSDGAITYSIVSGPATISGTSVTLTDAGTVVVGANQASSGIYTAATARMSFAVAARKPILTFGVPSQTYGTPLTPSATSTSNGAITYSVVSGPATVSGSTVTFTNSGQVVLRASQAATGGYTDASAIASFHVATTTPKLAIASIPTTPYNTSITVSASSPSPVAVVYTVASGPARIVGAKVTTLTTSGTVVIMATQPGANGYGPATATTSFKVAPVGTPELTFSSIPSKSVGDVFKVSATSSSNGAITYSVVSGPATLAGSTVTVTGAGTVVVKASQAAASGYNAATATVSITVTASVPTLTFVSIPTKDIGDVFTVSAASASDGAVTYSVISGPATITGSTVTATNAGTVTLKASQAATSNYSAATATVAFAVSNPPTLAFADISAKSAGDVFTVKATSPSSGAITYSVISGPAVILSGATCEVTGSGTVVVKAVQAAAAKYKSMSAETTFTATGSQPTTLTFQPIAPKVYGDTFKVAATSASHGGISYSVVSGPATLSGSTVTVNATSTDTVTLRASQTASGGYPAATAIVTFPVSTIGPSLSFASITPKVIGNVFTAKATSASNGAVMYRVISGPAHISGSTVSITGVGTVVLRADQQANGGYGEAHVATSFEVK